MMSNDGTALWDTIAEQFKLLAQWNTANIDNEPEQVRKNIETMLAIERA